MKNSFIRIRLLSSWSLGNAETLIRPYCLNAQTDLNRSHFQTSFYLTLKVPIITAADKNIFFFYFSKKIILDISCESSAWQMIHMKCQDIFTENNFF